MNKITEKSVIFLFSFVYINMRCQRCKNEDMRFFQYDQGIYYCRKCIQFGRLNVGERIKACTLKKREIDVKPTLRYELTEIQKEVSNRVCENLEMGYDTFLFAATGAGKTECTYQSICTYLKKGLKVGFAISRRQVVLEIAQRLRRDFPSLDIIEVTQGYTDITDGDIIVCTMHQLYRYPYGFDLLIMDEVDAFPYIDNDVLQTITNQACVGQKLYLSATPDEKMKDKIQKGEIKEVTLFKRPHKHPLCIPSIYRLPSFLQIILCMILIRQWKGKQILVFVPTKEDTVLIAFILSTICKVKGIHSSTIDKDSILDAFRNKELDVLVCTTLLERGITINDVQVIVYRANHIVFTCASLIQIYGRVGRNFNHPEGKGVCLCSSINKSIKECIKQIKMMNDSV